MIRILIIAFFVSPLFLNAQKEKLYLTCLEDTLDLGEEAKLILDIEGFSQLIPKNKDSTITFVQNSVDFYIYVTPKTLGKHVYGPYEFRLNNKKLKSNTIELHVIEPKEKVKKISIEISDTIFADSIVELTLSSSEDILGIKLKQNEFIKDSKIVITNYSNKRKFHRANLKTLNLYSITFKISFLKNGTMKISKELFNNLPPELLFSEKTILILEKDNVNSPKNN